MPESNSPFRRGQQCTLSRAFDNGQFVKLSCKLCKITHRYRCDEIMTLCGDVPVYEISCHFRCEKCGKKDYMDADFISLFGPDIGKTKIRRLVEIKVLRKPIWREEII